jgi:hypothetical protein
MVPDARPINGSLWGAWVRGGADRWEVVRRSWGIFTRNTTELMDLLNRPTTNPALALTLMGDDLEATEPFWGEFDQRLHNHLASAVSLVDHARRLTSYYEADAPTTVADYKMRNATIVEMKEAAFLRDLRNYLLHYGAPPIIQTLSFGGGGRVARHEIKLSSQRLLEWTAWNAPARAYLSSFGDRDGPVLGRDVAAYSNAMSALFTWLFNQRRLVSDPANVPSRFRINPPTQ